MPQAIKPRGARQIERGHRKRLGGGGNNVYHRTYHHFVYKASPIEEGSHMFDASFTEMAKLRKVRGGLADDNEGFDK